MKTEKAQCRDSWPSATFSASLYMENDGKIVAAIDLERRIDGTVAAADVQKVFDQFNVSLDEWAEGKVDFAYLAERFNADIEPIAQSDIVLDCLKCASIEGTTVRLSRQLERDVYDKVNKLLIALGGKWDKRLQGHVFKGKDPGDEIANFIETGRLEPVEKFDFFPTPVEMARQAARDANLKPGMLVLEPEVGSGRIARECAHFVGVENVHCYEIQATYCDLMRKEGYLVHETDFMTVEPVPIYDACVLNPPFRKQQDIDHVLHAYRFLKPGGRISAIMSAGTMFRTNAKAVRFREFLAQHSANVKTNPAGAFKESGTMVQTISVHFYKPATQATKPLVTSSRDAKPHFDEMQSLSLPAVSIHIPATPAQIGFDF